jgi:cardiolipin synthase
VQALAWLVTAGLTDWLDGWLARRLKQVTRLGQYLDPIADKVMLSSLFLALSWRGLVEWRVTEMVFTRDALILAIAGVLFWLKDMREFKPSVLGKLNTLLQIVTVLAVLLAQSWKQEWLLGLRTCALVGTMGMAWVSGLFYGAREIYVRTRG